MVECLDAEVGDPSVSDTLLRALEFDRSMITEVDDRLRRTEPRFLEAACATLEDPLFAARAGLQLKDGSNLNSYIAKHSKNLEKAVENSSRYYALFDPAFQYNVTRSGNAACFRLDCVDPEFAHFHRHIEFLVFTFLERGRHLTGKDLKPIELRFTHSVAWSKDPFEGLAGCPVRFDTEQVEILLPLWCLETPIPTFDPDLRSYLMSYGDQALAATKPAKLTLSQQIQTLVADRLPGQLISAEDVASALGMSRRTFNRRLEADGLTFRGVVDDLRSQMARAYLSDGFGLAETAFLIGYADQAAFSTAFKRWTGASPGAWRTGGGQT